MDTRTVKIFAFNFDGDKAPDGYFFVGKGLHVSPDVGVKVAIRGKDSPDSITPMNEAKDIILDLPENYDVYHIDFLSVYCYKFHVDFANVLINNLPPILPPYVPPFSQKQTVTTSGKLSRCLVETVGTIPLLDFRPAQHYVWYVNGYLAELYLKRGLNYTFNIEGGHNNSFYISDEPFGGYSNLESDEQKQVSVFAPKSNIENEYSERLCLWEGGVDSEMADKFGTFEEFRQQLHLECANHGDGEQKILQFNPDNLTPSTVYGNSYDQYGMGFKIHVVDELPAEIPDIHEPPFTFEAWTHNINEASSSVLTSSVFAICSLFLLNNIFGF
ncbi:hypothetical protein M3Y97_00855900 [Aphelenchoides bicaudatus]|nr:hypothetical protein M3Y97_00855900 [Aphelenchoides bicaudatus]